MGFDAFDVALDLVRSLKEPIAKIAARDPALASQLQRALSSAPLNLHEGRRRAGRDRLHHFRMSGAAN